MEPTCSVPPSPPLLSEERHRGRSDITSRGRATTTTAAATTTRSKQTTYNSVRSLVARYRQVAPVDTLIARGKLFSDDGEAEPENPGGAGAAVLLLGSFSRYHSEPRTLRGTAEEHVRTHVRQRDRGHSLFPSRFSRNRGSATRIDERRRCGSPHSPLRQSFSLSYPYTLCTRSTRPLALH